MRCYWPALSAAQRDDALTFRVSKFLSHLLPAFSPAVPSAAQCATEWLPGDGIPGVVGSVNATTMWDPDGAGPAVPQLVAAGSFTVAGGVTANRIATWNGVERSSLGAGMDGNVLALTTLPNGDLVAGRAFKTAGGFGASRVPPLVGLTFFHQMVPIELDVLGNWVSATATNALQLTAGMF